MNTYKPEGALIRTHKNYEYTSSKEGLYEALSHGIILEGIAMLCDHQLTLHIDVGAGVRAIMPRNEVQLTDRGEPVKDIAILTRVGKPVCFKVLGFERLGSGEEVAIVSRRSAQLECRENYISGLTPGDIIPTKITHLENFGAFVDIGCGITSLLSIDSISVSRIAHPSARLSEGDMIYTVVKLIDDRGRIYVSERELLGSWEENASLFKEGETVRGIIRSVESYGVFVELMPNLAGLAEYREDARVGQSAAVYIKSIIPEKMKIKLIIIDTHDEPTEPMPLEYFIDTDSVTHIDTWQYSPRGCKKIVETVF
ncbi:MAG: S1 RNA-binding domain-containing protein [Clostridia bacterium]|nr:S1 RNA-binding domain-containing protein [Clostridia bacterium]